ncbi:hypothetical protein [Hoylesella timonensis]|uniref:Uncharacterized protein n=1 Tax=Hoylesella timonensis CRIS 5C-B1 TaxID=679189 RepID=D1VXI8_9BACT|nr:hypothetical protein [Hoylesella timonensis]EFA98148.1 hypothetical protein HMPREF9019_0924 [Hoylesella timonensis CRIS 5C-B1]
MERLSIKDVPSDMLRQIRNQFESDVQIRQLRIKQNLLQRTGNFAKAMELGKTIESLYEKVIDSYIEETIKESDKFSLEEAGIPVNDIKKVNEYAVTMFMACDIIQSCIIDINDLLHKTDKDLHYEQFDDIKQISEMVKSKLDFLQNNSTYMNNVFWGDKCDDMYSMMLNKAKAIIRKRNNDKSWNVEFDKMKGE